MNAAFEQEFPVIDIPNTKFTCPNCGKEYIETGFGCPTCNPAPAHPCAECDNFLIDCANCANDPCNGCPNNGSFSVEAIICCASCPKSPDLL